jgi:hypothetical protein
VTGRLLVSNNRSNELGHHTSQDTSAGNISLRQDILPLRLLMCLNLGVIPRASSTRGLGLVADISCNYSTGGARPVLIAGPLPVNAVVYELEPLIRWYS